MKKFISLFLCFAIMITITPASIFAEEIPQAEPEKNIEANDEEIYIPEEHEQEETEEEIFEEPVEEKQKIEDFSEINFAEVPQTGMISGENSKIYNTAVSGEKAETFDAYSANLENWWANRNKVPSSRIVSSIPDSLFNSGAMSAKYDQSTGTYTVTIKDVHSSAWADNYSGYNFGLDIFVVVPDDAAYVSVNVANSENYWMNFESGGKYNTFYETQGGQYCGRWFELGTATMLPDNSILLNFKEPDYNDIIVALFFEMEDGTERIEYIRYKLVYECDERQTLLSPFAAKTDTVEAGRISPDTYNVNAYKDDVLNYDSETGILTYSYTGSKTNKYDVYEELGYVETVVTAPSGYVVSSVLCSTDCTASYSQNSSKVTLNTYADEYGGIYEIRWKRSSGSSTKTEQISVCLEMPYTSMEEQGLSYVSPNRIIRDDESIDIASRYGIRVEYDRYKGYFRLLFDSDADINKAMAAGADLENILDMTIMPPSGAVKCKYTNAWNGSGNGWWMFYKNTWEPSWEEEVSSSRGIRYVGINGMQKYEGPDKTVYFTADCIYDVMCLWWYDEDDNLIKGEYLRVYVEPYVAEKEVPATWMDEAGFSPAETSRILVPEKDKLAQYGINFNIGEKPGFVSAEFGENVDGKGITDNTSYENESGIIYMWIKLKKPSGAVSCTYNTGHRTGYYSDDYYYGTPGYTGDGRSISIDSAGYVSFCPFSFDSEWNGENWIADAGTGAATFCWYDSRGRIIKKEYIAYKNPSYNCPEEEPVVTWNAGDYIASGYCGSQPYGNENAAWTLDENGVLRIIGTGGIGVGGYKMYDDGTLVWNVPWADYADDITKVIISEGISFTGHNNLDGFNSDVAIYFLGNAPTVGAAFYGTRMQLYRLKGTTGWETDSNGKWNGYKINLFHKDYGAYGDLNADGKVNVKDVYYARLVAAKYIVPGNVQNAIGDVNADGKINVIDANLIRKFCANIIDEFPLVLKENDYTFGMGISPIVSSAEGRAQADVIVATVVLDDEEKIVSAQIDIAQTRLDFSNGVIDVSETDTRSKYQKKYDYGMIAASAIGKEWFEQVDFFEEQIVGMTAEEVAGIPLVNINDHMVADDETIYAGCTISLTTFQEAVVKACNDEYAKEFSAGEFSHGLGVETVVHDSKNATASENGIASFNTVFTGAVYDENGRVLACLIDNSWLKVGFNNDDVITSVPSDLRTRKELADDFGMIVASPIGKEWYEQMTGFENAVVGMTVEEISEIQIISDKNGHLVADDETIYAVCTISIPPFQSGFISSLKNIKYV